MQKKKVALITGIVGQDGSYLTEFLLEKGYLVRGILRRSSSPSTQRIDNILKKSNYLFSVSKEEPLLLKYGDMTDTSSLMEILQEFKPDEIYNLAAQSQVGISFNNPITTFDINATGTLRLLECIRQLGLKCKVYQASSSEMFGISPPPQNEKTNFLPQSPYGVAKLAAYHHIRTYRNAYNIFASNGILFNHESPRRGINFVTRKITREIAKIITGETTYMTLGNLDSKRDWGFSGEYVQAMWEILQQEKPGDFVIATEETHTVREFLEEAFSLLNLDYEKFIKLDDKFKRPAEVPALLGDATKAKKILNWKPKIKFKELVRMMVVSDIKDKLIEKGIVAVDPENTRKEEFYLKKARELTKKLKFQEVSKTKIEDQLNI